MFDPYHSRTATALPYASARLAMHFSSEFSVALKLRFSATKRTSNPAFQVGNLAVQRHRHTVQAQPLHYTISGSSETQTHSASTTFALHYIWQFRDTDTQYKHNLCTPLYLAVQRHRHTVQAQPLHCTVSASHIT